MDLNKLSNGDKVIIGSGIAFLIFFFFPWYGKFELDRSGSDYFLWGVIPLLLAIAMVVVIVLDRFTEVNLPDLSNFSWGQALLAAGVLAAVLVLILIAKGDSVGGLGLSVHLDRKFGVFLAGVAAIGLAVGGFFRMQEDKAGASGGAAPPPPPAPPAV